MSPVKYSSMGSNSRQQRGSMWKTVLIDWLPSTQCLRPGTDLTQNEVGKGCCVPMFLASVHRALSVPSASRAPTGGVTRSRLLQTKPRTKRAGKRQVSWLSTHPGTLKINNQPLVGDNEGNTAEGMQYIFVGNNSYHADNHFSRSAGSLTRKETLIWMSFCACLTDQNHKFSKRALLT